LLIIGSCIAQRFSYSFVFKEEAVKKKRSPAAGISQIPLHIMLLPVILVLFVYSYLPMAGLVIAFQRFNIVLGVSAFWKSRWVGFDNFKIIFMDNDFRRALSNTLLIAIGKIISMFFVPIIVALLLNEIRRQRLKKTIQTLIYMPHFLSWIVMTGIIKDILSPEGIINTLFFADAPRYFLGDPNLFQPMLIITNLWKEFGYSTIIYLAAITVVDPGLYEAAIMDGANRLKQTWHVTLPGMMPIIILTAILSLRGILSAGFDQIFNLYSAPVYSKGDVIDTLVYRRSMVGGQYDIGTAIGLFNSTVAFILILTSNKLAERFAGYRVF
jgi:putative aldouronate transport system permease protein